MVESISMEYDGTNVFVFNASRRDTICRTAHLRKFKAPLLLLPKRVERSELLEYMVMLNLIFYNIH